MDYARSCYAARMRFWDDPTLEVDVRWFRAALSALIFDKPQKYQSWRTWKPGQENEGPGEVTSFAATYDKGANSLGYKGKEHCGPDEAFRTGGIWGVDPPIETDEDGWSTCCGDRPRKPEGMAMGGTAIFALGPPKTINNHRFANNSGASDFYVNLPSPGAGALIFFGISARGMVGSPPYAEGEWTTLAVRDGTADFYFWTGYRYAIALEPDRIWVRTNGAAYTNAFQMSLDAPPNTIDHQKSLDVEAEIVSLPGGLVTCPNEFVWVAILFGAGDSITPNPVWDGYQQNTASDTGFFWTWRSWLGGSPSPPATFVAATGGPKLAIVLNIDPR